jgi:hypothetical protein
MRVDIADASVTCARANALLTARSGRSRTARGAGNGAGGGEVTDAKVEGTRLDKLEDQLDALRGALEGLVPRLGAIAAQLDGAGTVTALRDGTHPAHETR